MKIIFLILCFFSAVVMAENKLWVDVEQESLGASENFDIQADKFRAIMLDSESIRVQLNHGFVTKKAIELLLPKPDGETAVYQISTYDMMQPGLRKKFPDIQTFHGFNINDQQEKIYLDITPKGLHAMSLGGGPSFLIDPVDKNNNRFYASYYRKDYGTKHHTWNCGVEDHGHEIQSKHPRGTAPMNELSLKRYRLAVAATGEYTSFHGGTVNLGMAAIVTAMVRVNGIYENDLGIRMVLVADNDLIVYTNGNTDPYTNNSGGSMLGQNQNNLDLEIGSDNYDIGHVFSTGGGGVAYLGVPCDNNYKAGGVTGLGSPIGDVFWVDYVAHEMGHQWGGSHTFNSTSGSCGGGNRSGSSAFEPGSASTIQGYAGICGADNIQSNSDAYFHARSLDQMNSYASNGLGFSCANVMNNNNDAPDITVLSPPNLTIPANTPFELCAEGNDVDTNNNQLTFNWEQYDLGPAGSPNNPSGNAPIFRSFVATPSGCRAFPQWSDILNNTQTKGELLPSYNRDLSFRVTVRDNELNGGSFNTAEYNMSVSAGNDAFAVIQPNTAITVNAYDSMAVEWNVADTDSTPVSCSQVDIMMTTNGGNSFFDVILNTANDGIENIQVPNVDSNQVRIRVQCSDNVFFDVSNSDFTVIGNDLIFKSGFEQIL